MALHYDGEVRIVKVNMGPFNNNGYIVSCPQTNEGILIDTPAEPELLLNEVGNVSVKAILITHNHQDHLLGFDEITGSLDAPVGITTADKGPLPKAPDVELADGQVISFGNQELRVLTTPGHTDGASCFLVGKHLFSGDTLFPGGPGKSRSPEALGTILDSIRSKLLTLPDDVLVYPGHGDDTTIVEAKRRHAVYTSKDHPAGLFGDVDWLES
jgi:glyoxylase-like metal-dependent hydrolase (beta-lactamase superfamily II)